MKSRVPLDVAILIRSYAMTIGVILSVEVAGEKESKRENRPQWGEDPGQSPCNPPSKPKHTIFFIMNDLPCKRTCHGKGRMTKRYQNSSTSKKRINTDIFYIHNHSSTLSHAFIIMIQDDTASIENLSTDLLHRINEQVSDEIHYIYSTEPLHLQLRHHA